MFQNYTISNSKFSVSRRDTYYHSYKNLPHVCCQFCVAGYSHQVFCLLITLVKLNIISTSCKLKNKTIFLDIKQNSDMNVPSITFNASLLVVDGDEFLDTQKAWIWMIHSMTFHASLKVFSGYEALATQCTII